MPDTPEELAAEAALVENVITTVVDGIDGLSHARSVALADMVVAEGRRQVAVTLSGNVTTLLGQVVGFNASTSYSAEQLNQIRDAIKQTLTYQKLIVDALAEFYAYRKANDADAALSHQATEYIGRFLFGDRLPTDPI